jgi:glutamyl-tRNA reductase
MEILITGASHREAPLALREKLARGGLGAKSLMGALADGIVKEGLVISTCNRLEIVAVSEVPEAASELMADLLAGAAGIDLAELLPGLHRFTGLSAVEHLFRVASGLDSQVLGEAQILGQVKSAYRQAVQYRTVGPIISKLFHKSFQTAKRVRSETGLAEGAVSTASAAVETAQALLGPLTDLTAVIVGTGQMAAAAAGHLRSRGVGTIVVAGRSADRARTLAHKCGGTALAMEDLRARLPSADLVVTAVAADGPVLGPADLAGDPAGPGRTARPLVVLDLGLPRNVAAEAAAVPGVALRNMDDFEALADHGRSLRRREAERAGAVIAEEVAKFSQWLSSLSTSPTIKDLILRAETARAMEVERTVAKNGFSPEQIEAVEAMSRALVRRLLHNPLAFVKGCHRHGRSDHVIDFFRRVFGLDP